MRFNRSKSGVFLASVLFAASTAGAWADAIENLQGAWVTEDTECTGVFEKTGGKIRFKDRTFASGDGFIILGKKVTGPISGCTISQVEQKDGGFSAFLACSDALVARNFSMKFRVIDPTHFERLDPDHDVTITYKKCAL
ncbi:hypothetical protein SAZ10_33095 [Mesorhizobium sp. BAC0120]|uniref:hypothetical protein n=1 Tax=Mesorhizobium sp. BAC0120 TaxID=3090670 RepID=UPI00298C2771|nr:hypothetical protein [Mesorhizobium sp. BAC0120]MDW6026609.1 hypothetical protein [Mesorhizobium sp. BAC0120]